MNFYLGPTVDETSPLNYNKRRAALIASSPNVLTRARGRKILEPTSPHVDPYNATKQIIRKKDQKKLKTKNLFGEGTERNLTDEELIAECERSYINEMEILDETIDRKGNIEKEESVSKNKIKSKKSRKSECQEMSELIEITKDVVVKMSKNKSIKSAKNVEEITENLRKGSTSEAEVSDDNVSDESEYIEKEVTKTGRKGNAYENELKTMSDPIEIKKEETTKASKKKSIKSVENVEEIIEKVRKGRMSKDVKMGGRKEKVEQNELKTEKNRKKSENPVEDKDEQPPEGKEGGRKGTKTKELKPAEDDQVQPKKEQQVGRKGRKTKEMKALEDKEKQPKERKQATRKGRSNNNEIKPNKNSTASESDVEENKILVKAGSKVNESVDSESDVEVMPKLVPEAIVLSDEEESDECEIVAKKDVKIGNKGGRKGLKTKKDESKITVKTVSKINEGVNSGVKEKKGRKKGRKALENLNLNVEQKLMLSESDSGSDDIEIDGETSKLVKKYGNGKKVANAIPNQRRRPERLTGSFTIPKNLDTGNKSIV